MYVGAGKHPAHPSSVLSCFRLLPENYLWDIFIREPPDQIATIGNHLKQTKEFRGPNIISGIRPGIRNLFRTDTVDFFFNRFSRYHICHGIEQSFICGPGYFSIPVQIGNCLSYGAPSVLKLSHLCGGLLCKPGILLDH